MGIRIIALSIFSLLAVYGYGQAPAGFSYQAVVRDAEGRTVDNRAVVSTIQLRTDAPDGPVKYEEIHRVSTAEGGLLSLIIGAGNVLFGALGEVEWERHRFFIDVLIEPAEGLDFSLRSTTELLSVPYALSAAKARKLTGSVAAAQVEGLQYFSGDFNDLRNVPESYTKAEIEQLVRQAVAAQGGSPGGASIITLRASRALTAGDVGNTLACTANASLVLNRQTARLPVGGAVNVELHGTILEVEARDGIILNGRANGTTSLGDGRVYTGAVLRKTGPNSFVVL